MSTPYEKIIKAKTLLGLRDSASLAEIKTRYRTLMQKWHPDRHQNNADQATQMSAKINEAYTVILEYCNNYEYRFDEEFLESQTLTPQEWWAKKFGPS